jgi:hypothetical protein
MQLHCTPLLNICILFKKIPSTKLTNPLSMKLKIILSRKNNEVHLVNVDTQNTPTSRERDIDSWKCPEGTTRFRYTTWNNANRNEKNPYKYNRVNIHYTIEKYKTVTKSYYCIDEIIIMDDVSLSTFDSSVID